MKQSLFRAAAALCVAGLGLAFPAAAQQTQPAQPIQQGQQAQPERVLKATHGAWEVQCLKGTETCVMQQVGKTSDGKRAMLVLIERLAGVTAEGQAVPAAITVHTPMGVLIPYAVRVKIDQGEVHPVPLLRCLGDSCMARAPLRDADVQIFKKGTTAKFGFFLTDEVLVDISLNGFTAAFDSLKPVQVPAGAQN